MNGNMKSYLLECKKVGLLLLLQDQLFVDVCACCMHHFFDIIHWLQHRFEHFESCKTTSEMDLLWPLCRSRRLLCPPAIQGTSRWQSPATAQICLVPRKPRIPPWLLPRCPWSKVMSCKRCPTASCRATPASGTLRTFTNLSPLFPVGPNSGYCRLVWRFWSCVCIQGYKDPDDTPI